MDAARFPQLRHLLERLLDETPAERAVLLADVRRRDPLLADELSRLLGLEPRMRDFMEPPGATHDAGGGAGP